MRILLGLLLLIIVFPLQSAVYKWVDEEGNVHYGDQPVEQAEKVRIPGVIKDEPQLPEDAGRSKETSGALEGVTESEDQAEQGATAGYAEFAIVRPEEGETFRNDEGEVEVGILLSPALKEGHKIQLHVDASVVTPEFTTTQIILRKVSRGSHQLKASILNANGEPVSSASVVNFHMRKAPSQVLLPQ